MTDGYEARSRQTNGSVERAAQQPKFETRCSWSKAVLFPPGITSQSFCVDPKNNEESLKARSFPRLFKRSDSGVLIS